MYKEIEDMFMDVYNSTYDTAIHQSGRNETIWRNHSSGMGNLHNLILAELRDVS